MQDLSPGQDELETHQVPVRPDYYHSMTRIQKKIGAGASSALLGDEQLRVFINPRWRSQPKTNKSNKQITQKKTAGREGGKQEAAT